MQIDVDQTMDILTQLVILIGGLIGVVGAGMYALKRWIRSTVASPTERLLEQVEPNGGRKESTRHLVEEITETTNQILDRVEELEESRTEDIERVEKALKVANEALVISKHTGDRLDNMIERRGQNG